MFNIDDNNKITITRGDTAFITIALSDYTPATGDKLTLSVKYDEYDTDYLFTKEIDAELLTFEIKPEDTKPAKFEKYIYDIQLTKENGEIYTIIEPTTFKITREITV